MFFDQKLREELFMGGSSKFWGFPGGFEKKSLSEKNTFFYNTTNPGKVEQSSPQTKKNIFFERPLNVRSFGKNIFTCFMPA